MWRMGVAVFAVSALSGGLFGWSSSLRHAPVPSPVVEARPAPVVAPKARWAAADFLDLARSRAEAAKQPEYNPLSEKLTDWTDEEIHAALDASLTDPTYALADGAGENIDGLLLGEWVKRDLVAAVAWFDTLESRSAQSRLALSLSSRWPADKAEEGFEFIRSHRNVFPAGNDWPIIEKTLENRAKQGVSAVEGLLGTLRREKMEAGFRTPIHFPDGFDFARLAATEEFQNLWDGGKAIRILENMEDSARRIGILENAALPPKSVNFGSDNEALLRKKLMEWNATPAQVEAIITRFKP